MRSLTLISLFVIFVATLFVVSTYGLPEPWVVLLLGLSASFGGRSVAYMAIFEWLRKPFSVVTNHSAGVGESVEPRTDKGPIIQAIGDWLCCPVCAGTWVALGLLVTYTANHDYGLLMMYVLSAGAIGSTLTRFIEWMEWEGRYKWEMTGQTNTLNKLLRNDVAEKEQRQQELDALREELAEAFKHLNPDGDDVYPSLWPNLHNS